VLQRAWSALDKALLPAGGPEKKRRRAHWHIQLMIVVAYLACVCLAAAWYRRRLLNSSCSERRSLQINFIVYDVKAATASVREFLVSTPAVSNNRAMVCDTGGKAVEPGERSFPVGSARHGLPLTSTGLLGACKALTHWSDHMQCNRKGHLLRR
jgi:hypothetical protein